MPSSQYAYKVRDRAGKFVEGQVEAGGDQVILDRIEPLGALGMASSHVVAAAVGMAVEGGRHRAFAGGDF